MRTKPLLLLLALALAAALGGYVFAKSGPGAASTAAAAPNLAMGASTGTPAGAGGATSEAVRTKTQQYMQYERNIQLDPAQQKIKEAALTPIPAPCCSDNSALTCCCPCNLSRTVWGLTAHLIAEQGVTDPKAVQTAVEEWIEEVKGPGGFSGDTCYTGGCGRAFNDNGCGGMNAQQVTY